MRRSISGPLIVIVIGVLFFCNNFFPDAFSWHALSRGWPFLLIGLGVIRLIEVMAAAGNARPLPSQNFAGGGFVAFVLLAFFIFWGVSKGARHPGVMPFVHGNNGWMFADSFDFDVQQSLPVNAGDTRLILEGMHGNISLTGDDSSDVTVSGHRSIRCYTKSTASVTNKRTHLEVVRNGNDIVVRSTNSGDDSATISYDIDIKIPRRLALAAQGGTENVTAESLDGGIDISGETGNVRLTSIGGNVRVETTRRKNLVRAVGIKGNLDLRGTGADLQLEDIVGQVTIQGSYFGTLDFRNLSKPLHFESEQTDLRVEKVPGSITMDLSDFRADDVTGPLRLRCHSRDVHINNFSNEIEVNVERGDVQLSPQRIPLGKMDVHLRSGDIDLTIPDKAPFALRATTSQGAVDNQYGKGVEENSEGSTATLKSETNGGPAITITTDRGNITVKKS